jgi:enediyne polyketide synthase
MNNPTGNHQELMELLSHYFSQRGSFLAQVIRADLQTLVYDKSLPIKPTNGNSKKYLHGFTNVLGHSNTSSDYKSTLTKNSKTSSFSLNSYAKTQISEDQPTVIQPSLDIARILIDLVTKQTGYPAQSISLDSRLLDDLNLDSIKAGELIAAAAKECGVAGSLDPSSLANATLKEIAQILQSTQPEVVEKIEVPVVKAEIHSEDLTQILLQLVEERTGFPKNTLNLNLRLLDDLNLDSIKAADLIATVVKKSGVSGTLEPSTLANATLAKIITALQQAQPKAKSLATPVSLSVQPPKISNPANWVRNFAVEYVPHSAGMIANVDWSNAQVLLVGDEVEDSLIQAMSQQLSQVGAIVQVCTYAKLADYQTTRNFSDYIAILPQTMTEEGFFPLNKMISRLQSITSFANGTANLAYVQFGGGYFGSKNSVEHPEVCCAAGFARSVHLERPQTKIRVIDLAQVIPAEQAAKLVISELESAENIITVGYDAQQTRLIPQSRLQQPIDYLPRSLSWSTEDVILVTGGAKGITTECAIALAQQTRVKMALVGRSPASDEIKQTLNRFQSQGLTCRYYVCDIAYPESVSDLVQQVTQDLGKITGVIHGAGLNQPRRVEQVSFEAALTEVSPKLLGAYNLLEALAVHPPKLFLAFSSIIGLTGMAGNTWYAFANESLSILLRHFQKQHPTTQVLSLAYSVWDEVGMGAKLGSVKHLERMGISAISPLEGVSRFLKLFECDPGVSQVVIPARLGGLDTWQPVPLSIPLELRFIEKILYIEPHVAVTVRTHLSLERDLYVKDHIWRGSYLFPTVFGLEAMTQAIAFVTGTLEPEIIRLENISLRRPVVVNESNGVEIEIHAEVAEKDENGETQVKVGIRTEQTGFNTNHFSATFVLGQRKQGEKIALPLGELLAITPDTDLYGSLLFQGKLFQQLDGAYSLSREQSLLQSHVCPSSELAETGFPLGQGTRFLLGDPYFRDVLLQSMQLNIPQDICLPVQIDEIEILAHPSMAQGDRIITAILNEQQDREYICEVIATTPNGQIVEHLKGYRLRILEEHPENPTAIELANPNARDEAKVKQILGTVCPQLGIVEPAIALDYQPNLGRKTKQQRRVLERPLIARTLQDQLKTKQVNFNRKTLASGKPQLVGSEVAGLDLSLSHDSHYCLCSIGQTPQGCDIESITHRNVEDWDALLGTTRQDILKTLMSQGDERDIAGTRIWSAIEAIRKVKNGCQPKLSVFKQEGAAVVLKAETETESFFVLTLPVQLTRYPQRMMAIVVELAPLPVEPVLVEDNVQVIILPHSHRVQITKDGPQGQPVYEQRFQVSFKQSCSISRKVTVSQYITWVGKIRELPMRSIASSMVGDFTSGEWGMVTNAVSLRVLGEATSYDTIQARCWLGNVINSSFDTYIEFCKVLADESLERIAIAEVKATWVRLVEYGIPTPVPFPEYLQQYLDCFAAKKPASIDLKNAPTDSLPALPQILDRLQHGNLIYEVSPQKHRYGDLLSSETFQTTLEESNLVGNVYYGNYFIWQGRMLDLFLYSVAPEYLRVSTAKGEMVSVYSRMDYLREAMPFDKVRVYLYIQSVTECGAKFTFEFFRELANGTQEKLQIGQQEIIWAEREADGIPVAKPWPKIILNGFLNKSSNTVYALVS